MTSGPPVKPPAVPLVPGPTARVVRAGAPPSHPPTRGGSIPNIPTSPPSQPPTIPPPPPPRKRAASGSLELRDRVLLAAIELVNTEGVNGLSLRAAAERVGVTHPAVYRYFPDKASLLAAVAEEGFRAMRAAILREWSDMTDPADRFRQLVIAYVRFALDHPTHFRIMFGREAADKGAYPTLRAAEVGAFSLLVDAIIEAQRGKLIRAGDPRELALSGWVMVHGFASLVLDGLVEWVGLSSTEVDHLAGVLTRSLFQGIGALPLGVTPTPPTATPPL